MRKPQGYAVIAHEDGSVSEWDTFTCAHCQYITRVGAGQAPEDCGGFCRVCMSMICGPCADKGVCLPFERKLEIAERRQLLHSELDRFLAG